MARTASPSRRRRLSPASITDVLQIVKCVLAAATAWWFARDVLRSDLAFLAPWTALLSVHPTVEATVTRGLQTLAGSALGVLVAFVVAAPLGRSVPALALTLLVGMALSRLPWLRQEGVAVATTALFVVVSGSPGDVPSLLERLAQVGVGVGVGLIVNTVVVPPLRDDEAAEHIARVRRRLGDLLAAIGDELDRSWDTDRADAWVARTRDLDAEVENAWAFVRFAHESGRWNLRRRHFPPPGHTDTLAALHEGISHARHLVRTVAEGTYARGEWDEEFRTRWTAALRETGRRLPDPGLGLGGVRADLDALATDMSRADLPDLRWPVYGSLITSLRHLTLGRGG